MKAVCLSVALLMAVPVFAMTSLQLNCLWTFTTALSVFNQDYLTMKLDQLLLISEEMVRNREIIKALLVEEIVSTRSTATAYEIVALSLLVTTLDAMYDFTKNPSDETATAVIYLLGKVEELYAGIP